MPHGGGDLAEAGGGHTCASPSTVASSPSPSRTSATWSARSAGPPRPRAIYERAIALEEPQVREDPTNMAHRY